MLKRSKRSFHFVLNSNLRVRICNICNSLVVSTSNVRLFTGSAWNPRESHWYREDLVLAVFQSGMAGRQEGPNSQSEMENGQL